MKIYNNRCSLCRKKDNVKIAVKSCIQNPAELNNHERKPYFYTYQNYDWKDYFILSFLNPAINWRWQETFVLVSYKDWEWLQAKQIWHIEFATNTKTHLADIDWIPTLFVTHEEPDSADEYWTPKYQNWEYQYTETFDLKNQERKIGKKYEEYA